MRVRRQLDEILDDAFADDPRRALIAARRLRDDLVPWLEHRAVLVARRDGWKWARIGRLLGMSRQAVHKRFATRLPRPVTPNTISATDRGYLDALADHRRRRDFEADEVVAW